MQYSHDVINIPITHTQMLFVAGQVSLIRFIMVMSAVGICPVISLKVNRQGI